MITYTLNIQKLIQVIWGQRVDWPKVITEGKNIAIIKLNRTFRFSKIF